MKIDGVQMHGKTCALALLLLFRIAAAGAQRIVSTFEPLKNNERLAYNMSGAKAHTLNLYAQDSRSLKTTCLLGSWDGVHEWAKSNLQKTERSAFFSGKRRSRAENRCISLTEMREQSFCCWGTRHIISAYLPTDGFFFLIVSIAAGAFDLTASLPAVMSYRRIGACFFS
ncbi:hypothetical protein [Treponema endosymbiont of Eucomonympha sp.]|uniref:hypothetical protein n=1 Tax=Treponema endosymbiont of Eucomonympha sp. TaxID=1580831 RepID=UPI0013968A37|nr:hypothetical protein [Treponema endosymbiont of Eucomonympha sp.]